MGYLTGPLTADQAVSELQSAIDLGNLTGNRAQPGDPIFAAVATAQDVLQQVQEDAAIIGPALTPGTRTWTLIDNALEGVYQAAANVRNDPAAPLSPTVYTTAASPLPWGWIAAGGALLVLLYQFQKKGWL